MKYTRSNAAAARLLQFHDICLTFAIEVKERQNGIFVLQLLFFLPYQRSIRNQLLHKSRKSKSTFLVK